MKIDKEQIRRRALELTAAGGTGIGAQLAKEVGVSRQVANGYLQALESDGLLQADGSTRAKVYRLVPLVSLSESLPTGGLDEDRVWREVLLPHLRDLPDNVQDIWHYGATEMINNAIDHSGAQTVQVGLVRNALFSEVTVADNGVGIFLKIQRALGLDEPREAILELVKGKLTTDPDNHTGEGIFFTSRAMDAFHIRSDRLHFRHQAGDPDILDELAEPVAGTELRLRLDNASERDLTEVFNAYADPEEFSFDRTVIPMRLAQFEGQKLISRSQAKRIAHRFERFKRVELDFAGVESIGQAFADELFRVFARNHPTLTLVPVNTAPAVDQMIRRAVSRRREG
jgi:anti-sigma regulatory factor (Ser/Thr protein kinase)